MRDMLGREDAISVEEAQKRIASHFSAKEPPKIALPIEESYERVLAEDVLSPEDLPGFSRSTVDGFAVFSSDTFGATESLPAYLNVAHEILMGEEAIFTLKKGDAAKIPTGGMLPKGSDAVVMLEYAQCADEGLMEVFKPVAPGENVVCAGEDMREGERILTKGHMLRPQDVAALAGIGVTEVMVYEKPKISIISTGDEIVPARDLLRPGQVRDINSYNLSGLIDEHGGLPIKKGIIRDIFDDIYGAVVDSLVTCQMVIITGGSSVGVMDMTSKVIESVGAPGVIFHGVTLKPGKPTVGGVVNGIPVFGLPGHPAAVTVCFDLFIQPILKKLTGVKEKEYLRDKKRVHACIAKNVSSSPGREEHIRVALEARGDELWAIPVLGKSGLIRTLVMADGTVVIPAQVRGLQEGDAVEVLLF
ncbi:MAG TPA: gephyrin-like molybdotransferase Glp [Thermodesulfovibrionales bacterium]|nr:gephyrin-like molybdotransferase Glp [Thermodesulfovibrionales bacterium]